MGKKLKGTILISLATLFAVFYTVGTVVDFYIDISWLDWRLFLIIPAFIIALLISFVVIGIGILVIKAQKLFPSKGLEGGEGLQTKMQFLADKCPMMKLSGK